MRDISSGEENDIGSLARVLNCRVGDLLTTYLGVLLGASHMDHIMWKPVIQRVENRLAGWRKRYLSKGGKSAYEEHTF